jgi:hypothetical protein
VAIGVRVPGRVASILDAGLDKAIEVQRPAVVAYLNRLRAAHPNATPAQIIGLLERHYRTAVVGIGTAAGAAAAVPGVGTGASLASGAAEITAFISATAMFVLAEAEVHGLPISDPQLRRALVLTVLVGDAAELAELGAERQSQHWAQVLGRANRDKIAGVNGHLAKLFVTRVSTRQGALLFGRALPMGIGAGIGAAGNAALARAAIKAARQAFGPPPVRFPARVIDSRPAG